MECNYIVSYYLCFIPPGLDGKSLNQELFGKFHTIVNELTPQRFHALAEQALKLEINTEERLGGCIDIVYTKVLYFYVWEI